MRLLLCLPMTPAPSGIETYSLRSLPTHGGLPPPARPRWRWASGPGGCDSSLHCLPSGMDELMEVSFSPLAATGKPLSRCGKCHRFMKYIQVSGVKGCGRPSWPLTPLCTDSGKSCHLWRPLLYLQSYRNNSLGPGCHTSMRGLLQSCPQTPTVSS